VQPNNIISNQHFTYGVFLICLVISVILKLNVLEVGAPFVTIDDNTTYEGGFLVWFGQAPPQRMYIESWINGLSSIITYIGFQIINGGDLGINIVADAYSHYASTPDLYVRSYRIVSLFIDLLTAYFVYLTARIVLPSQHNIQAFVVTAMYLLSYNTIWCYVVARPDTPMALFSTIGLYLYYSSDFGKDYKRFILSALLFGAATGMKLHGAFFVVFIIIDLFRVHGLKAIKPFILPFGILSVITFAVAAGSVLFDPLNYIKLRALNVKDDASPWIESGEQFFVILKGTGIFTVPLIITSLVLLFKNETLRKNNKIMSVVLLSILWLILFSSIRQLRAYWMLPALPLFYIVAIYVIFKIKNKWSVIGALLVTICLMTYQSFQQSKEFQNVPFNEFRAWVQQNVKEDEKLFIFGYDALFLPLSKEAQDITSNGYRKLMIEAKDIGQSYTERHVRFWEERSKMQLFDMYSPPTETFTYYSMFKTPLKDFSELIDFDNMNYIVVLEGIFGEEVNIDYYWKNKYSKVITVNGPGGGGTGLNYTIYKKVY
jgi:hypothetical protein